MSDLRSISCLVGILKGKSGYIFCLNCTYPSFRVVISTKNHSNTYRGRLYQIVVHCNSKNQCDWLTVLQNKVQPHLLLAHVHCYKNQCDWITMWQNKMKSHLLLAHVHCNNKNQCDWLTLWQNKMQRHLLLAINVHLLLLCCKFLWTA